MRYFAISLLLASMHAGASSDCVSHMELADKLEEMRSEISTLRSRVYDLEETVKRIAN